MPTNGAAAKTFPQTSDQVRQVPADEGHTIRAPLQSLYGSV